MVFLALTAWFVGLLVPYWGYSNWEGRQEVLNQGLTVPYQIGGSVLYLLTAFTFGLRYVLRYVKLLRYNPQTVILLAYFAFQLASSAFSIAPIESAIYALYTAVLFLALGAVWTMDRIVVLRGLRFLLIALLVYLTLYMVKNIDGVPHGAFPKNQFAKSWQVALVLVILVLHRRRLVASTLIAAVIAYLSSRSSLITSLFVLAGLGLQWVLEMKSQRVRLAFIAVLLLIIIVIPFLGGIGGVLYSHVLALDDDARGLDAGLLTGRQYRWRPAIELIGERPLAGYGFRTRGDMSDPEGPKFNAHMGYLNLMLDSGVLGGSLLLYSLVACILLRSMKHLALLRHRGKIFLYENLSERLNYLILLFIVIYAAILFSEPIYLNLGQPFSVLVIMFLAAPLGAVSDRDRRLGVRP